MRHRDARIQFSIFPEKRLRTTPLDDLITSTILHLINRLKKKNWSGFAKVLDSTVDRLPTKLGMLPL